MIKVGISLDDFMSRLDELEDCGEYIVRLAYKYDWEKEYTISNECLSVGSHCTCWFNDWNEGQTDVRVLGYVTTDAPKVCAAMMKFYEEDFADDQI